MTTSLAENLAFCIPVVIRDRAGPLRVHSTCDEGQDNREDDVLTPQSMCSPRTTSSFLAARCLFGGISLLMNASDLIASHCCCARKQGGHVKPRTFPSQADGRPAKHSVVRQKQHAQT